MSGKENINIVSEIKVNEPVTFTVHYRSHKELTDYLASVAKGRIRKEGNLYKIVKKSEKLKVIKTTIPDESLTDIFPSVKRHNNYLVVRSDEDIEAELRQLEDVSFRKFRMVMVRSSLSQSQQIDLKLSELATGSVTYVKEKAKLDYLLSLKASFTSETKTSDIYDYQDIVLSCTTAKPLNLFLGQEEIREVFALEGENAKEKITKFERIRTGLSLKFKFYDKGDNFYADFSIKDDTQISNNLNNSFNFTSFTKLEDQGLVELVKFKSTKRIFEESYFLWFFPLGKKEVDRQTVTRVYLMRDFGRDVSGLNKKLK